MLPSPRDPRKSHLPLDRFVVSGVSLFDGLLEDDFRLAYRTRYTPFYPEGPIRIRRRRRRGHSGRGRLRRPQRGSLRHCLSVPGAIRSSA